MVNRFNLFSFLAIFILNFNSYSVVLDSVDVKSDRIQSSKKAVLDSLLELHYNQQPLEGNFNANSANVFNLNFAKMAYQICKKLNMFDTLQALAVDIGYIHSLREEYDSAFTYYFNTISLFEEMEKYDKTFSLTQNVLYNNNTLYKIIEADKIEQKRKNREIVYLFIIVLIFLLIIIVSTILFYKKLKVKNQQISAKNRNLEDVQSQIKSSLDYAQNIQNSIVQNEIGLTKSFSDSFVLFKPKDTVSGDFLWTNKCKEDVFMAVADCTGHGVPGALLSIVGNFLLDAVVNYHQLQNTNEVLDKLHHEVIRTLNKNVKNQKLNDDGMDIALLRINTEKQTLQFSGANRSVYIVRTGKIIELKGDRRPIGETMINYHPFKSIEFELQKNDIVYSFSDGYYDQFNINGKKLLKRKLLQLLLDTSTLKLEEQRQVLINVLSEHQGNVSQTDDILVVGIKI
ncbi:MAG: SpoIIE family protein phosphatase [Sediminibacterium sp.]|nr:SpoIIE family protein phosphatase [Sediminibacterium sp.]